MSSSKNVQENASRSSDIDQKMHEEEKNSSNVDENYLLTKWINWYENVYLLNCKEKDNQIHIPLSRR